MTSFPPPTEDPVVATPGGPAPGGRRRVLAWLGAGVAVLAVVAGGIAAGGLNPRSDRRVEVAAGAPMDAGNLVYTFTDLSVQRVERFSGPLWQVVAAGTVMNRQDTPLAPLGGDYGSFLVYDEASGLTAPAESGSWVIGDHSARALVPPGEQVLALEVMFELPLDGYTPTDTLAVAVAPMEFTDNSVLGLAGGEKAWNIDSFAPIEYVTLPVTRLPDEVSE